MPAALDRRSLFLPARRLRRLARRWGVTAGLAGLAALISAQASTGAVGRARALGDLVPAAVVRHPVVAGDTLTAADVGMARVPRSLVPAGALTAPAAGRTALVDLHPGEILLAARLAPGGLHGPAALIPPGWRALAVPASPVAVALRPGSTVDLLATFDVDHGSPPPDGQPPSDPTVPVAAGAVVVATSSQAVTVAVPAELATRVAFALARGTIALALVGP